MQVKQAILRIFCKRHGLQMSKEGSDFLESVITNILHDTSQENLLDSLEFIAKSYIQFHESANETLQIVTQESLENVLLEVKKAAQMNVNSMEEDGLKKALEYLDVIDAFHVPQYRYKPSDKSFTRVQTGPTLLAPAIAKAQVFKDRYYLLLQRIMRNEGLSISEFQSGSNQNHLFTITPIKNLNGRDTGRFLLFGMLTLMKEGIYFLEDPDACIEVEFSAQMKKGPGMFTCNTFVLAQGEYTEEKKFVVDLLGMPPPESRRKSKTSYGNDVEFFGARRSINNQETVIEIEKAMEDAFFVILSDVWLDQHTVMMKLNELFRGYSQAVPPLAFILIGNFISTPYIYNSDEREKYKAGFDQLYEIIKEYPNLMSDSYFIFVPGPNDPWCNNIFPRPCLPDYFVSNLKSGLDHAVFASSPARIKYCSQEIVIFREDLLNTMRRNCIVPPVEDVSYEEQLVSTILDQAHLLPLPFTVRPIFWAYDHALRIYPQPHLLILADKCEPFNTIYEDTLVLNPGSFSTTLFTFMVYQPSCRDIQKSQIF